MDIKKIEDDLNQFFDEKENVNQNTLSLHEIEKLRKIQKKIGSVHFIKDLNRMNGKYEDKII